MAELAGEIRGVGVADEETRRPVPMARWWAALRALPITRQYVVLLLVAVLAKQAFQVVVFPPFSGHDEVAHFAYVRTVAEEHRVPVLPELDEWRAAYEARRAPKGDFLPLDLYPYQQYALDWCCEPATHGGDFDAHPAAAWQLEGVPFPNGWQYAANHPPLFYAAMTPIYWATNSLSVESQQYALRAAVIPFWLAIVWLSYLIVRSIFPRDSFLAMTVPTFVAFQTQLSYEGAMINNDILSFAIFTLILYQLTRGVRLGFTLPRALGIGLVLGLGLLTKGTLITAAPLIAVAMVYRIGWRSVRRWASLGAVTTAVAGAISAPWFIFLYRTYGNFDGLEQISALQSVTRRVYRGSEAPSVWDQFWNWSFLQDRWRETWAEFGWRRIHADDWLIATVGLLCAVLAARGLVYLAQLYLAGRGNGSQAERDVAQRRQRFALLLMVLTILVAYGAMLQFGTRFTLTQARYYFQALVPLAILLMVGLRQLLPVTWRPYGAGGVLVAMVALNVIIYTQHVIPYWYLAS